MKRRKTTKDFPKKKKKLGKGKQLPNNATVTTFKSRSVHMPVQLSESQGPTTFRKLSLQDLLRHLGHPKPSVRKDGLMGIRELLQSADGSILVPSIGDIMRSSSPLFTDNDSSVRHSLYLLLKEVFQTVDGKIIKPFFPLLLASLKCGLTHINSSIQESSLKITDVVISCYPILIKGFITSLIPLYLPLVAMKTHQSSNKGKKSDINLYVAKQPVLSQLLSFMLLLGDKDATPTYHNAPVICTKENKVWFNGDHYVSPPCDLMSYYTNTPFLLSVNPNLFPTAILGHIGTGKHESQSLCGTGFENQLVKVLLELWIEIVTSSLLETGAGSSSSDLCSIMSTILQLFCLMFDNFRDFEYKSKFSVHFSTHFVPYFPLFTKGDLRPSPHILMLNLYFSRLTLIVTKPRPSSSIQPHPLSPIQSVVSFLSTQLPHAPSILSSTDLVECVSIIVNIIQSLLLSPAHTSLSELATPLYTSCRSLFISCHPHSAAKLSFLSFIDKITRDMLIINPVKPSPHCQLFLDLFLYPALSELPRLLPDLVNSLEHVKLVVRVLKTALTCQIDVVMNSFCASFDNIQGVMSSFPWVLQQDLTRLESHTHGHSSIH